MSRYIRLISIFLVILFLIIPLGSCREPVYHYSGETQNDDVAVMGTVDVSQHDSGKKRVAITYDEVVGAAIATTLYSILKTSLKRIVIGVYIG